MNRGLVVAAFLNAVCTVFAGYNVDRIYSEDRFESAAERVGKPELVKDYVSRGLLELTGMGVYRGEGTVPMSLPRTKFPVAAGGKTALMHSIRVYDFGTGFAPAMLRTEMHADELSFHFDVISQGRGRPLRCVYEAHGFKSQEFEYPLGKLPADFAFTLKDSGEFEVSAVSLADSSRVERRGRMTQLYGFYRCGERDDHGYPPLDIDTKLVSRNPGPAEVKVDDHFVALVSPAEKFEVPAIIRPEPEFDPVKAGWPLVFADEFEGTEVDWSKWYFAPKAGRPKHGEHLRLDGKGVLEMEMAYSRELTNQLDAVSLRSKPMFGYGYYEARVKVTKEKGWWAAFWAYGRVNSDPFVDGFEIDIFEDYYCRWRNPDGTHRFFLDHNIHMPLRTNVDKSWNYNSIFPERSTDDWITIGCKRTPFEITYYLDGRAIPASADHSPWPQVTFDAFNHGAGTAPLCLILSQQVHSSGPNADKSQSKFPEIYYVDYVRAYAMPRDAAKLPRIEWAGDAKKAAGSVDGFDLGEEYRFEVEAAPAGATGAKLKAVYLFDSGYLIGCRTEPPYVFRVEMTPEWYAKTAYMKTGRQRRTPDFRLTPHTFKAFVQDENGEVAFTEANIRRLPNFGAEMIRTDEGAAPGAVPGKLEVRIPGGRYSNQTELVNRRVEIAAAGTYRAKLRYGLGAPGEFEVFLLADGRYLGRFVLRCDSDDSRGWTVDKWAELGGVKLPAGAHTLSLYFNCAVPANLLELERTGD